MEELLLYLWFWRLVSAQFQYCFTVYWWCYVLKGKVGLGREDFVRQQLAEKRIEDAQSVSIFRQRKQERLCQKRVKMDLYKSQLACEQLDSKMVRFLMHLVMVSTFAYFSVCYRVFSLQRRSGFGPWMLKQPTVMSLKVMMSTKKNFL